MSWFADLDALIASLHPNLAGVDSVQLLSVAVVAWLGTRAIAGRRSDEDDEPTGPRVTIREATRLAAKRRKK